MPAPTEMAEETDFENGSISNFQHHVTLTLTLAWAHSIPSCIAHWPLPTYQISFKLEKLTWTDRPTYIRHTDIEAGFTGLTRRSRPNNIITYNIRITGQVLQSYSRSPGNVNDCSRSMKEMNKTGKPEKTRQGSQKLVHVGESNNFQFTSKQWISIHHNILRAVKITDTLIWHINQ